MKKVISVLVIPAILFALVLAAAPQSSQAQTQPVCPAGYICTQIITPVVSAASAALGAPTMIGNRTVAFPVTFTFTITAGGSPIYLDKTINSSGRLSFLTFGADSSGNSIIPRIAGISAAPSLVSGDTSSYYAIPAGSSRMFVAVGSLNADDAPSSGLNLAHVVAIYYGISPSRLAAFGISEDLQNLRVAAIFSGSTASTQPSVTVNGQPTMALSYSARRESALTSTFNISISSGARDVNILQNSSGVTILDQSGHNQNLNEMSVTFRPIGSALRSITDDHGQAMYVIPAGQTVQFQAIATANPQQMFAGSYHASLVSILANQGTVISEEYNMPIPSNTTNNVTISGEVSPYITAVTSPISVGQMVTVTGVRLGGSGRSVNVLIDGRAVSGLINSAGPTSLSFTLPALATGHHLLTISDVTTGLSNRVGFEVQSSAGNNSVITVTYPQAGYTLENGSKDSGRIATITWTSSGLGSDTVGIALISSAGAPIKYIANGIANTGSYVWPYDPTLPSGTYQIQVYDDMVRGGGAAGMSGLFSIVSRAPSAGSASLTLDATSPIRSTIVADAATHAVRAFPFLVFDINPSVDAIVRSVTARFSIPGNVSAIQLYKGSTLMGSAQLNGESATFAGLNDPISANVRTSYSVKADVTGVTTGSVNVSASVGQDGIVVKDRTDHVIPVAGSAQGSTITITSGTTPSTPPASITMIYPAAGTSVTAGATMRVAWTNANLPANTTINNMTFTLNGGGRSTSLAVTRNSSFSLGFIGSFNPNGTSIVNDMAIPANTPAGTYTVTVACPSCGLGVSAQSASFSILASSAKPSIALTAPAGGQSILAGGLMTLSWTSQGIAPSDLVTLTMYDQNNTTQAFTIGNASGVSNTGSYVWSVPSNIPAGAYAVQVVCKDCVARTGVSTYSWGQRFNITAAATISAPVIIPLAVPTPKVSAISVNSLGYGSLETSDIAPVSWTTDQSGVIGSVTVGLYKADGTLVRNNSVVSSSGGPGSATVNLGVPAGTYKIRVIFTNRADSSTVSADSSVFEVTDPDGLFASASNSLFASASNSLFASAWAGFRKAFGF